MGNTGRERSKIDKRRGRRTEIMEGLREEKEKKEKDQQKRRERQQKVRMKSEKRKGNIQENKEKKSDIATSDGEQRFRKAD